MGDTPCGPWGGSEGDVEAVGGGVSTDERETRALCTRSARPIPDTHAPRMTARNVRNDTGNPENGVRITRMPRRMSVLLRDIDKSISGHHDDDKFAADAIGMSEKMRLHIRDAPRDHFFMNFGEFAGDDDA